MSNPPQGLGYRQRAALTLLTASSRPLPTGYIRRQALDSCDPRVADVALRGLAERGLIQHVRPGL